MSTCASPPSLVVDNKSVKSLYILKALASFSVVIVHGNLFCKGWLTCYIDAAGMPCFLVITGYLLYSCSADKEFEKCLRWAKKAFRLGFLICLVYLAELLFLRCFCSMDSFYIGWFSPLSKHLHASSDAGIGGQSGIFFRDWCVNLLTGERISSHLWYLTALWQALLIFALIRRFRPSFIRFLPLLFVAAYFIRAHSGAIAHFFSSYLPESAACDLVHYMRLNAVVPSLLYLSTGYLLHRYETVLLRKINVVVWLPLVICLLFTEHCIRLFCFGRCDYWQFLTYPFVVLLVLTCLRFRNFSLPILEDIGKNHSPNIYYFHMLFLFAVWALNVDIPAVQALVVWLLCIPFSMFVNFLTGTWKRLFPSRGR